MSEKIKIMFVLPSLGSGGAERVVSVLSNELYERSYDVSVVLLANKNISYEMHSGVKLFFLEGDKFNGNTNPIHRTLRRTVAIKNITKMISPNIVVSFMSDTNMDVCMALFFSKIPLVVSERNDPSIDPASNVKRLLRNVLYCRPNWFVFQTPDAKRYFSKKIQDRSNIVLNPLSGSIPDCWLGEREKRIVSVGRLNNQKNFPLLIEAFLLFHKKHPDYILEIYGDGMLEDKLKSYISDCQLEEFVFLKGFI